MFKEMLIEAKKPKLFKVISRRNDRDSEIVGTLDELIDYFSYTLEVGTAYQHEKGNKKIDKNPKTIKSLIKNLNNAGSNASRDGYSRTSYLEGHVTSKDEEEYEAQ
jgi:hypothetical protein